MKLKFVFFLFLYIIRVLVSAARTDAKTQMSERGAPHEEASGSPREEIMTPLGAPRVVAVRVTGLQPSEPALGERKEAGWSPLPPALQEHPGPRGREREAKPGHAPLPPKQLRQNAPVIKKKREKKMLNKRARAMFSFFLFFFPAAKTPKTELLSLLISRLVWKAKQTKGEGTNTRSFTAARRTHGARLFTTAAIGDQRGVEGRGGLSHPSHTKTRTHTVGVG